MAAEPKLELDNSAPAPLPPPNDGDDSSVEPEDDPEALPDLANAPDQPPPKRKGGRKPVRLLDPTSGRDARLTQRRSMLQ